MRWQADAQEILILADRPVGQLDQAFRDQRAGHDGVIRKVKREEILAQGHVLDAAGALAMFELGNPIDEQESHEVIPLADDLSNDLSRPTT